MANNQMYCFRANWKHSAEFDEGNVPHWLCVGADWQGYTLYTVPEVADVARILGALEIEDTPSDWISHLESLGLKDVTQVSCEEMFEDKGYCL